MSAINTGSTPVVRLITLLGTPYPVAFDVKTINDAAAAAANKNQTELDYIAQQSQATADTYLYTLQAASGYATLVGVEVAKKSNVLINGTSIFNDVQKLVRSYNSNHKVNISDVMALISDGAALASVYAAAGTGGAAAPISAILLAISAAAGLAGLMAGSKQWSLPEVNIFVDWFEGTMNDTNTKINSAISGDYSGVDVIRINGLTVNVRDIIDGALSNNQSSLAYRYWLDQLNAVIYNDVYDKRLNIDHAYDLYSASSGVGEITVKWVHDRAAMLSWLYENRIRGSRSVLIYDPRVTDTWRYDDIVQGVTVSAVGNNSSSIHLIRFGSDNSDNIFGAGKSDHIFGMKGNDVIHGLSGDDYIEGGTGNDELYGDDNSDALIGMGGDDELHGGSGNDYLVGGAGQDKLYGDDGNDILVGYSGQLTTAEGGDGNDLIYSDNRVARNDVMKGGDGNDLLESYGGTDNLDGGEGNDLLKGGNDNDTLLGGKDNDQLQGESGVDTLQGDEGADLLQGGSGQDIYQFTSNSFGADLIDDADGTLMMSGGTVTVGEYDEQKNLWSNNGGGPREIRRLVSEDGSRTTIVVGNGDDVDNVLYITNFHSGNLGLSFSDPPEREINASGSAGTATGGNNIITGLNQVQGGGGNDYISGTENTDKLYGGDGNDFLSAYYGDDFLDGGAGKDILIGGKDRDIIYGGNDDDVILSSVDWTGTAGQIISTGGFASQGDQLSGDYAGLDFYADAKYDQATKSFTYYASYSGQVSVNLYPSIDIGLLNVEGDKKTLLHTINILDANGIGNIGGDLAHGGGGKDFIVGGGGADIFYGEDGEDNLYGRGGSDQLFGGKGKDNLYGGDGIDLLDGGAEDDGLFGGYGADVLYGGGGADLLLGDLPDLFGTTAPPDSVDVTQYGSDLLYGGQGRDTLMGGGKDDWLYGEEDSDSLYGEEGNDWLFGGAEDDLMFGDELDINSNVAGNDHLEGGDGVDRMYGGGGDDYLQGGEGGDFLYGNAGNDFLQGGAGTDKLDGGADDDVLEGGAGDDTLQGGGGDDVYVVNLGDGSDTLIEDVGSLATKNNRNIVFFKFDATQVTSVQRLGSDLIIRYGGGSDQVKVQNYYAIYNSSNHFDVDPAFEHIEIASFYFEDGTVWETSDIMDMAPPPEVLEPAPEPLEGVAYFIDALVSRNTAKVTGKTEISYGLASEAGDTLDFTLFTQEQVDAIATALSRFESALNVHFVKSTGAIPDLTFYMDDLSSGDAGSAAGYANSGTGEVHLNSVLFKNSSDSLNPGQSGFEVLLHEIGHVLGLKHPFEEPTLPAAETTQDNTVMAYADNGLNDTDLKLFDVAALQYLYGVNTAINAGDDAHGFSERYIQDGGGHDHFDASGQSANVTIDLNEGGWSYIGTQAASILAPDQSFIGYGTHIEDATSGSGNDALIGNAMANVLSAGEGEDTLTGGAGNDTLAGGDGMDTYVFRVGDGLDYIDDADTDSVVRLTGVSLSDIYQHNGALYYSLAGDGIEVDLYSVDRWEINGTQYSTSELQDLYWGFEVSDGDLALGYNSTRGLLLGSGDASITGNYYDNHLRGNAGNNLLDGGDGADTLIGGLGDDTYIVDNLGDQTLELAGQGHDQVWASVDLTLADKIEDLLLLPDAQSGTGNALDNRLTGNDQNNLLAGLGGNDTLTGGLGDDRLDGGAGADSLVGGEGNDTYLIDNVLDVMTEAADEGVDEVISTLSYTLADHFENLTLLEGGQATAGTGNAVDNVLQGNNLDNTLSGEDGADTLRGGDGNDTLLGGTGADMLDGEGGVDVYLYAYGDGADTLMGADLNNDELRLDVTQEALRFFQQGADLMIEIYPGGADNRIRVVDYFRDDGTGVTTLGKVVTADGAVFGYEDIKLRTAAFATPEADLIYLEDTPGKSLHALAGNDTVWGSAADDNIFGDAGDDYLDGGDGNDYLDGGMGTSTLIGGAGNDLLVAMSGNAELDGGEGDDTYYLNLGNQYRLQDSDKAGLVKFSQFDWNSRQFTFDQFFQNSLEGMPGYSLDDLEHLGRDVKVTYDVGAQEVSLLSRDGNTRLTFAGIDPSQPPWFSLQYTLDFGGRLIDAVDHHLVRDQVYQLSSLLARSAVDIIGTDGDDLIQSISDENVGDLPSNRITAGAGNDTVYGGYGWDQIQAGAGDDEVYAGEGDDRVGGDDGNDVLHGDDGHDALFGHAGDDQLYGGNGNDTLTGGDGADYLAGGAGDDVFVVNDANDTVYEQADSIIYDWYYGYYWWRRVSYGDDTVISSLDYTLGDSLENLTLVGDTAVVAEGNALRNILTGNDLDNRLSGMDGNDTLSGGLGNDTLLGGDGYDILDGGDGDDWLEGNEGWSHQSGGAGNDTLTGGDAFDTLDGGAGDDLMMGGKGYDEYHVDSNGDRVVESAEDAAIDTVYSWIDYTLTPHVEELILEDEFLLQGRADNLSGTGNELDNYIRGNAGNNLLQGLTGNDTLDGGGGDDRLLGGDGNDELNGGLDGLHVRVDYEQNTAELVTLASNNDYLDGGDGDDVLDGACGNDTLYGGLGNDVLRGGSDPDPYVYYFDSEESIEFSVAALLPADDELHGGEGDDLLDGGSGNDLLVGDGGTDMLLGGDGNDVLDARDGGITDVLEGGAGDDTYLVDAIADSSLPEPTATFHDHGGSCGLGTGEITFEEVIRIGSVQSDAVFENPDEGHDVIISDIGVALPENVEEVRLTGTANVDVLGSYRDDRILGNSGNNILVGGEGADTLIGGDGDDAYFIDNLNDLVVEAVNAGHDTVITSVDGYTLADGVENLYLAAGVASGAGNALDNLILGNNGDNLVQAGAGNDRVRAAGGNDTVLGGLGDDTYIYYTGDGDDVVLDAGGDHDILHFSADIRREDLVFTRDGDDLLVTFANQSGSVRLQAWATSTGRIEAIQFCGSTEIITLGDPATNEAPVVADDAALLREDQQLVAAGSVLANDTDPEGQPLLVANAGEYDLNYGHLSLAADGSYQYVLNNSLAAVQSLSEGQTLSELFRVDVLDTGEPVRSARSGLSLTITGVNDAAQLSDDVATINEDSLTVSGNVLDNDTDPDSGDSLSVTPISLQGQYGVLTLAADGSYVYALDTTLTQGLAEGSAAQDIFSYTATDGRLPVDAALTITITGSNDAPLLTADSGRITVGDAPLTGNVLGNDADADAGVVLQTIAGQRVGQYGTLELAADGGYAYALNSDLAALVALGEGQEVVEHFRYTATDGLAPVESDLTITVAGRNDAPLVTPDAVTLTEDSATVSGNVLANDRDPDAIDRLSVVNAGQWQGQFGLLTLGTDGAWSYVLDTALTQSLTAGESRSEQFTYQATDGRVSTASTLTLTITGVNDAPVTTTDSLSVYEDDMQPGLTNILSNDMDADAGTQLQVTATVVHGQYGDLTVLADGTASYLVNNSLTSVQSLGVGQSVQESFQYLAGDGMTTTPGNLVVTVQGVNDAPVLSALSETLTQNDSGMTVDILSQAGDVDTGDVLSAMPVADTATTYGHWSMGTDGVVHYQLDSASVQSLGAGESVTDILTYAVSDGHVMTSGQLRLTITGLNDGPVVSMDTAALSEDTSTVTGNVLMNDHDPDATDLLSVANAGQLQGRYGVLALGADGAYVYTLDTTLTQGLAEGSTAQDIFSYTATDSHQAVDSSLTITITGSNDAPVLAADSGRITVGDAPLTGNVLGNDADADAGTTLQTVGSQLVGQYGTLELAADGGYAYALNSDLAALVALGEGQEVVEHFRYTATDGLAPVESELTISVVGRNDAAQLADDVATIGEDSLTVSGNVLDNDTDPDSGDSLSVTPASLQGRYGVLTLGANGTYVYTLDTTLTQSLAEGSTASDVFNYTATDGRLPMNAALTITITGSNDAPVLTADSGRISVGYAPLTGNVLANDADADVGTALQTVAGQLVGQYGTLELAADGRYAYTLTSDLASLVALGEGQEVVEHFRYTATDGLAPVESDLTITVVGRNDQPTASPDSLTISEDDVQPASVNVLANDLDPDQGDVLSAIAATLHGQYGDLVIQVNGQTEYRVNNSLASVQQLASGQQVQETFSYQTVDNHGASANAGVTVNVIGRNDVPVATGTVANQTVVSGNALSLTLSSTALFSDVDQGDRLTLSLLQGNGQALPTWLSFNAQTGVLSGTPTGAAATYSLSLTATDLSGAKAALTFNLNVTSPAQPGVINGTDGSDVLNGTSGNDVIDGRGGSDTMSGGTGDDIYYVDTAPSACGSTHGNEGVGNGEDPPPPGHDTNWNDGPGTGPGNPGHSHGGGTGSSGDCGGVGTGTGDCVSGDRVVEAAGQGYDLVRSTVSYSLADNVEALELLGVQAINATGNSLANRLTGNSADNRLDGGTGADRLIGLGGNDTYVVDNVADVIVEEANGGTDSVESALSWTLGVNLENLRLTGNGALSGTGNALANRLQGNTGNNTLTGLAGNDTYAFDQGWGKDTVVDQDSTSGNRDVLSFGEGISIDELWFTKKGNNLVISQIGTNDSVTVQDWYKGDANHVEEIRTADGHKLDHTKVAQLVQAMSGMSAPTGSQSCLSQSQHQRLDPVIAVTWTNG